MSEPRCVRCGHPKNDHNFRHPFTSPSATYTSSPCVKYGQDLDRNTEHLRGETFLLTSLLAELHVVTDSADTAKEFAHAARSMQGFAVEVAKLASRMLGHAHALQIFEESKVQS